MTLLLEIAIPVGLWTAVVIKRWRDEARWEHAAVKMGRAYSISAREDVTRQVAHYLRWQWAVAAPLGLATLAAMMAITQGSSNMDEATTAYMGVAICAGSVPLAVALSNWRSWNQALALERVAHLKRPTMRQTFAPVELALLVSGLAFALVAGAWGLWHKNHDDLSSLWVVLIGVEALLGMWGLRTVFNRPTNARDDLELGWDDVLRHKEARDLSAIVIWTPAAIGFLFAAYALTPSGNLIPIYLAAALGIAIHVVFRQGRTRWQDRWDGDLPH